MCARHSSSRSNRFPLPHPLPSFHETTLIKTFLPGSLSTPHPILLAPLYNYKLLLYISSAIFFLSPIINDATCLYSQKSEKKKVPMTFLLREHKKMGGKKKEITRQYRGRQTDAEDIWPGDTRRFRVAVITLSSNPLRSIQRAAQPSSWHNDDEDNPSNKSIRTHHAPSMSSHPILSFILL